MSFKEARVITEGTVKQVVKMRGQCGCNCDCACREEIKSSSQCDCLTDCACELNSLECNDC